MKKRKQIKIGNVLIGGGAPVSIQSMTNTDTRNVTKTVAQIKELASIGCEIIRVAIPDQKAVDALPDILAESPIPVIADIHFDYKLALGSLNAGIHALRINPGNIGTPENVEKIAKLANEKKVPIRVGANTGSLPKGLLEEKMKTLDYQDALVESLIDSALSQCRILENCGFTDIKVSLKASDVPTTVKAYRKFSTISDYPLHIGVTEAGTLQRGTIKSAIGIGALLLDGIGDTLRVSLTADPVEEIKVAIMILESIGLRHAEPEIVSCPTCGRTEIDLLALADDVEALVMSIKNEGKKINLKKIAIMGCVVNGPGEAKDADLGVTGGRDKLILFKKGQISGTYPLKDGWDVLKNEIIKNSE